MKKLFTLIIALCCWTFTGAQDFQESAAAMGINTGCGSCGVGCGLSFVDFNGDGWDDLTFATQDGDSILFYQNDAGAGFTQLYSLVPHDEKSEQVLWLDYDNDGDQDLFVTTFGGSNRLYQNDGSLGMTDVTVAAGLPNSYADPSYGAVAGDYNNDGFLDIYVANWSFPPTHENYLFSNDGDGTFTDMTSYAMIGDDYNLTFCSAFLDINGNGRQDLYNSQDRDQSPNSMFRNEGDSTFMDISASSGTNIGIDAMDVGVGDYDGDGDLDIYITNTPTDGGSALLRNNGDETFTDIVDSLGVTFITRVGWGGNFFDCENDGDLDLYVCAMGSPGLPSDNALYINQIENDTFVEMDPPGMANDNASSFANAMGDFNQDGLTDIAVNNANFLSTVHKFHLWENIHPQTYNWIKINLEGVVANRDGVGSWIEVWRDGNKYVRYTHSGIGYLSQNSKTELIGLKDDTVIDTLIVKWLSGNVNKMYNVAANQTLNILENTTPLDVELLSFTGEATDRLSVQLDWVTASEENNKGFQVQRSIDGVHFNNLGWVNGRGTTIELQNYQYEDFNIVSNTTYYYRLRQLDFDASTSFSKVVTARIEGDEVVVGNFYPNPANSDFVALNLSGSDYQTANIELYDLQGVLIYTQSFTVTPESNTIRLNLDKRWTGLNVARISVGEKVYFRKLLIDIE